MAKFEAFGIAWVIWFCVFVITERVKWSDRNRLGLRFVAHAALACSAFVLVGPAFGLAVGLTVGAMALLELKRRRAA